MEIREIYRIKQFIETDRYFQSIKDSSLFSLKIYNCYGVKLDIVTELKKASLWLNLKNKTKKRYDLYIMRWLNNAIRYKEKYNG